MATAETGSPLAKEHSSWLLKVITAASFRLGINPQPLRALRPLRLLNR